MISNRGERVMRVGWGFLKRECVRIRRKFASGKFQFLTRVMRVKNP